MTKGTLNVTKKQKEDKDLDGLRRCCEGVEMTSKRMRKATLEFLWDKYVTHAKADPVSA